MEPTLESVHLKIARVRDQLQNLFTQIEAFEENEAYRIDIEFNDDATEVRAIWRQIRPIPAMWGVLVGEVVHNLRSILDHLARQIVIAETKAAPVRPGQLDFIIADDEKRFDGIARGKSGKKGRLSEMSESSITLLKSLQPFATGEGHKSPLWHLNELANFDKHRTVVLASIALHQTKFHVQGGALRIGALSTGQPLVDGTRLAWAILPRRTTQVEVKGEVAVSVAINQPAITVGEPMMETLVTIANRVFKIVERVRNEVL
jgi:hypothetical protein